MKNDLLVASSIKQKVARLNLNGKWLKNLHKADLEPLRSLRGLKLNSPNMLLDDEVIEKLLPFLHDLRELDGLPRGFLPRLAKSKPPFALEKIVCVDGGDEKKQRPALDAAFKSGKGLPNLVDLRMSWSQQDPSAYRWIFDTAIGRRMKVLRVNCYYFGKVLLAWQKQLEKADVALEELQLFHMWTLSLHKPWRRLTGDLTGDKYGLGKRELDEVRQHFEEIAVEGYS